MPSVTSEELCLQILEVLYDLSKEAASTWGVNRDTLLKALQVSEKDMDANVMYLAQRNMVAVTQADRVIWFLATITPFGKDVVENRQLYERRFPFLKAGKPGHR